MKGNQYNLHYLFHNHEWNPELLEYYVYKVFRTIAFSLLTVFLPIFLYVDLGYNLFQISLFFLISSLFFLLFIPISAKVIKYLGVKHTILIHLPGMAIFAYCLRFLTGDFAQDLLFIFLIQGIRAITKSPMTAVETYFMNEHILNKKKKQGSSLAAIQIVLILGALIAPLVGGFVAFYFGFEVFFNVAILFMILAAIPFFFTKDEYFEIKEKPKDILYFTFNKFHKNFHIAEFGRWFSETILYVVWPVFLIIVVKTTANLGVLLTMSGLIAIIATHYLGEYLDKNENNNLLNKLTNLSTSIFFARVLFPNPLTIGITDAVNKIVQPMNLVPYSQYYFSYLKTKENKIEASIAASYILEVSWALGIFALVVIFGIVEYFNIELSYYFFVALFIFYGLQILFMKKMKHTV